MNRTWGIIAVLVLLAGCGANRTRTAGAAAPTTPAAPSAAEAASWAAKWCQATLEMTRADLIHLMGTPTQMAADGSSISWFAFEWGFNAFFTSGGMIRSLEIAGQPSAAEQAAFTCAEIRRPPA